MRVALAPVTALVWGYDKIKDFLEPAVAQRLANLRPEHIITPSPMVAGPAIEALRFAGHDPTLREMYATLLATAMDANRVRDAHPAFVEIIRQLTADEARIVGLFATSNDFPIIRVAEILTPSTFDILLDRFSILGDKAKCSFRGSSPHTSTTSCAWASPTYQRPQPTFRRRHTRSSIATPP